jgi:UDP-N-acetylglucosamine acyltransferase
VDPAAKLAGDVVVGPFCVIGPKVTIGAGTRLDSHVIIEGRTTIGEGNRIFPRVSLGQEPQDMKFKGEDAQLIIGDRNDIRENVTMHIGTDNGGGKTVVGSNNFIMIAAHIAHDCIIGDGCVISNNVMLAGHIIVQDYAVLAGAAGVSHYVTIGRYAFIGGISGVVHDCPPFMICDEHPARVRGVNHIGLTRHGFTDEQIEHLRQAYRALFKRESGTQDAAIVDLLARYPDDPHIAELCKFVQHAAASPNGRYAETVRHDDKRVTPTR